MTRAIDANEVLRIFKLWIDTKQVEGEELKAIETCIAVIEDMPTLTPPNEKLTCDGCIHEYDEHENCNYCQRAPFLSDYYYRYSPKE